MKRFLVCLFGIALLTSTITPVLVTVADEITDLENKLKYLKEKKAIESQITDLQNQLQALEDKYSNIPKTPMPAAKSTTTTEPKIEKAQANGSITAQQFVEAFLGNTMLSQSSSGKRYKTFLQEKGRIVLNGESGFYDEGKWEISNNKLCFKWKKIRNGDYYCTRDFERDGDIYSNFNESAEERTYGKRAEGTNVSYQDVKH